MTRRRHLLTATAVATDGDALLEVYATTGYLADAVAHIAPEAEVAPMVGPGGDRQRPSASCSLRSC